MRASGADASGIGPAVWWIVARCGLWRLAQRVARAPVDAALTAVGDPGPWEPVRSLGGSQSAVVLVRGALADYVLKYDMPAAMAVAEARGLRLLAAADAVRVPAVIDAGESPAFVLLGPDDPPAVAERLRRLEMRASLRPLAGDQAGPLEFNQSVAEEIDPLEAEGVLTLTFRAYAYQTLPLSGGRASISSVSVRLASSPSAQLPKPA